MKLRDTGPPESVPFALADVKEVALLRPANQATGNVTGNSSLQFPTTGFTAEVVQVSGAGNATWNGGLEQSLDGSTWTTLATFDPQLANDTQKKRVNITQPYLRASGNLAGSNGVLQTAVMIVY